MKRVARTWRVLASFSVVALVAAGADASERRRDASVRGAGAPASVGASAEATPVGREKSVQIVDESGRSLLLYADGSFDASSLGPLSGFSAAQAELPSIRLEDGTQMYADGSFGELGSAVLAQIAAAEEAQAAAADAELGFEPGVERIQARDAEELKGQVAWREVVVDGVRMDVFANGTMFPDVAALGLEAAASVAPQRPSVPFLISPDGQLIYADGASFWQESDQK